ncbi:MAG TPA: hypothetical protein VF532_22415 [Candidatus Angelobacter sp.]
MQSILSGMFVLVLVCAAPAQEPAAPQVKADVDQQNGTQTQANPQSDAQASVTSQSGAQTPAKQTSSTKAQAATQPTEQGPKNPLLAGQTPAEQKITNGYALDSARKSGDNPQYITMIPEQGEMWNGYLVKQIAELGGRISWFGGNEGVWDSLVNLGSGPRLLEYTLDMHQTTHSGLFFDELTFSNFGYGGDPLGASHFRMTRGTIYSFFANFRRDQNIFDYNLLANPLNPTTSVPFVPILNSPHEFLLSRNMSDVSLRLFSLAPIRITAEWSNVTNQGTVFSTIHQGTEALLNQQTLYGSNTYHAGVSLRYIPKTSIDYDQYYTYFKGDNGSFLNSLPFVLPGGAPVDLGISFNTGANQPCAVPLPAGFNNPVNPVCNGFLQQNFQNRTRVSYPTEQVSFQSSYFRNVDFSGRFNYSSADANLPSYNEIFRGFDSRVRRVLEQQTGSANATRNTKTGDFGITWRFANKWRLLDTFRYNNFAIPTGWAFQTNTGFGTSLGATPTPSAHAPGSGPDAKLDFFNQFIRQEIFLNTVELDYAFKRNLNGYIGFRYGNRQITFDDADTAVETFLSPLPNRGDCAGEPVVGGVCTVTLSDSGEEFIPIKEYSGLLGISYVHSPRFRASFDGEWYYADNTFTRIAPRHFQLYRIRFTGKPKDWVTYGGAIWIRNNSNNTADIGNTGHNRNYSFSAVLAPPTASWGLDLNYAYNNIFSQTNICFVATPVPATALSCGAPFQLAPSVYKESINYGGASVYLKPFRKMTLSAGYTITSAVGSTLILNPNSPTGPLSFNYTLPMAMVNFDITKKLSYKTGWNYYDYNEKSDPGPTLPRDFHGNVFTLSLRYSM